MKKHSVFIVEDDLISAQYLKEILEAEGFEVKGIADNAQDALDRLQGCSVDIVLMDIILKGVMTGSEAAVILKHLYPKCKIIFLTAYADEEMIEYALNARAIAYLMKPYREKEIIATIRMALQDKTEISIDTIHISLKHGFSYNTEHHCLEKEGREIPLSSNKRKLIEILAKNRDNVVSNTQLSMHIWNEPDHDSNLRSLISRLRKTIDHDIVTNANGLGYMITSET